MAQNYDVVVVGAGAAGVFMAYEFVKLDKNIKVCIIDQGGPVSKRKCPIDGKKVKSCIHCKVCSIMHGFGGAGGMSDGKYNITNNFGGDLYTFTGKEKAIELMQYVDKINLEMGGQDAKLYSTTSSDIKAMALKYDLHLLDAQVRHLGTDRNMQILQNIYDFVKDKIDIKFYESVQGITGKENDFTVITDKDEYHCSNAVVAAGRSGSKWISEICDNFGIKRRSNRVDIGVRVEIPAAVFEHITSKVYESKIVYRTKKYGDLVRTFCMNPYGESIARLSNMLGGGVLVQRFGDLVAGRRTNEHRFGQTFLNPTLKATPGDLSLVIPKRQLDDIIEMIYALDKIAPGMANIDTLLYGVEVKFYNSRVDVDENLETAVKGLYVLGDGSGVTHSLSQASASGVFAARTISEKFN